MNNVSISRDRDQLSIILDGLSTIIYVQDRAFIRECVRLWLSLSYNDTRIVPFPTIDDCCASDVIPETVVFILYGVDRAHDRHDDLGDELAQLARAFPAAPVILLSDFDSADDVLEAITKGVRGFISTSTTPDVALGATHVVRAGGSFVPESCLAALRSSKDNVAEGARRRDAFTPRQIAVLKRLRLGKANRTIAHELEMSESRVKAHVRNLMQKLNATNRTEVAFLTKGLFNERGL